MVRLLRLVLSEVGFLPGDCNVLHILYHGDNGWHFSGILPQTQCWLAWCMIFEPFSIDRQFSLVFTKDVNLLSIYGFIEMSSNSFSLILRHMLILFLHVVDIHYQFLAFIVCV